MNIIQIIAQDVFDKVRGRFSNVEMGDQDGSVTTNSRDAKFFDFDFTVEGKTLGRVSISLNEVGTLKVFYSQGITEGVDSVTLSNWYDFLREMRYFSKRRMLRFDTRDISKGNLDKNDFQYLAQNGTKENNMNESSMYGSTKTSYRKLENTRLVVRHAKEVNEGERGARSRHIKSLYIENQDGERFKYPFIHLAGAKAMQRHVANGGRPYDEVGSSIVEMSEQISQLVAFKRHVGHHDGMNKEVNEILERSHGKLQQLRDCVNGISGQKYYESWVENLQPNQDDGFVMDQATMEDYKSKFTVRNFKEDLAQYFPLIHTIMQETSEIELSTADDVEEEIIEELNSIDDFAQFESWADSVTEGSLAPDTIAALKDMLEAGLTYGGPDATSAIESLQSIGIYNDELETALKANAELNADGDPSEVILSWLSKDDPEAAQELSTPSTPPAPVAAPAEMPAGAIAESPEDRTSYQVAKILFDKGIEYDTEKEEDIISAIGMILVKELNMSPKQARHMISYDEDFVADTLSELQGMEQGQEGMENEEEHEEKKGISMREIAEFIKPFYNKHASEQGLGEWRKGPTELGIMASKQFGSHAGKLVEKYAEQLVQKTESMKQQQGDNRQFEEIKRLAGLSRT
jgi:hypothetical protein